VSYCRLGDDGLRPLFQALPANTHLRVLTCHTNYVSDAFAADALLPAVRANKGLRRLYAWNVHGGKGNELAHEAECVVLLRGAAA
jgi:hypothetical protein